MLRPPHPPSPLSKSRITYLALTSINIIKQRKCGNYEAFLLTLRQNKEYSV